MTLLTCLLMNRGESNVKVMHVERGSKKAP